MSFGPPPSVYTESAQSADRTRARRRRRLLAGAAALLVAAALVAGSVALWPSSGDDAKNAAAAVRQAPDEVRETHETAPASPEGEPAVQHNEDKLTADTRYGPGLWATDKLAVRGVATRLEGYRIAPGQDGTAWSLKLEGHLCAVSRDMTADHRTAVVIQPPHPGASAGKGICDQVVFVDLDTGKKLWQRKMPGADFAYVTNTDLALTKGVVAIAWGHGSVAYDMASGTKLWNTSTGACQDQGYAGGRALLALVKCGQSGDESYRVQKLDARTGKPRWTYQVSKGVQGVYLPSADPPVLAVEAGDIDVTDLITLDGTNGHQRATISMSGYEPLCGSTGFSGPFFGVLDKCPGLVVGRDRLYVMSKESDEIDEPANRVVAFDLQKGTMAGKFEGRPFQNVVPLRADGDDLILYRRSIDEVQPASVVAWNSRMDKETPYLFFHLPEDDEGALSDPEQALIVYEHGHVFFAAREMERDGERPKDPVLSVLGVGSAGLKH
ncbi:PQQ-binding-like beta-propeller repeat protein [Streptomyces sp. NBC_01171]|uniref:outer membrane protein assembly factor BamB family protein n=1 Tax=Streptomyces sp. NBC_01171 TaxID=2903757 RepID=UPI0038632B97|nr:PQQ-binding-like beta-propeller repeat protein [Streptomyces sp. NBC_01171]